ncbi:MAG: hypothetical protein ACFCBW_22865 [Candidatus Competibacterales bacterium]
MRGTGNATGGSWWTTPAFGPTLESRITAAGVAASAHLDHIKNHHQSHGTVNAPDIVPVGPELDFTIPHGRGQH